MSEGEQTAVLSYSTALVSSQSVSGSFQGHVGAGMRAISSLTPTKCELLKCLWCFSEMPLHCRSDSTEWSFGVLLS